VRQVVGLLSLLDPRTAAAAAWAVLQLRRVRRVLPTTELAEVRIGHPPRRLPVGARRVVVAVLRRRHATCLQQSLILQTWDRAHGVARAVVIGVTAPAAGFRAHAWLDGEGGCDAGTGFQELLRLEA
jgi:hypothetical protein